MRLCLLLWHSSRRLSCHFFSRMEADLHHSPLASSMFAPGIPAVLKDFRSTSSILASMVVSGTWFLCFLRSYEKPH